jgi:hypothetical protein
MLYIFKKIYHRTKFHDLSLNAATVVSISEICLALNGGTTDRNF